MLGSHNSLSYLKPIKLIDRLLIPWSKCQRLNLKEQYKKGVRYFDIRLRKINNSWHFVHNRVDYGKENYDVYQLLDSIQDKIYIRFMLDERKTPKNPDKLTSEFLEHIYEISRLYENIIIDDEITFWNWKHYIKPIISVKENHASVCTEWYEYIFGTKYYARNNNHLAIQCDEDYYWSSNKTLMLDFVEYG